LIDTGAKISVIYSPGAGISDIILRTKGTIKLRLFTGPYETTHIFHVMEGNLQWQHNRILGHDWRANISYCD
jgi:hypothetical protein